MHTTACTSTLEGTFSKCFHAARGNILLAVPLMSVPPGFDSFFIFPYLEPIPPASEADGSHYCALGANKSLG